MHSGDRYWAKYLGLLVTVFYLHVGCGEELQTGTRAVLTPDHGPMSGYFVVTIQQPDFSANDVEWVRFGGVSAIALEAEGEDSLKVMVQGNAISGAVEVLLGVLGETVSLGEIFLYDPPLIEETEKLYAIGASLTEGTQRGLPTPWSIIHGPAAQLARQLGAYFPLPVFIEEGFQEMTPDLIGAPPYCQPPPMDAYQLEQAADLIPKLVDPETGEFSFALVRADPTLVTHNLAVGGSRVWETVEGPSTTDIAMNFLGHCVYEPWGTVGDPMGQSQVEVLEAAKPSIVMSFDLLGNDLIDGMIDEADFIADNMTPLPEFLEDIDQAVERLAATGAEVFLSNLPNPANLPFFRAKRARLAMDGLRENATQVFSLIDEGAKAVNARVQERADLHANVHIVDVAGLVEQWIETGVLVGGDILWVEQYGGLVGLDGLHFTDTAYALIANAMLEEMSVVLGREIPLIDVAALWAQDREHPERLKQEGFNSELCESFP